MCKGCIHAEVCEHRKKIVASVMMPFSASGNDAMTALDMVLDHYCGYRSSILSLSSSSSTSGGNTAPDTVIAGGTGVISKDDLRGNPE